MALEVDSTDRQALSRELLLAWVHLAVLWAFAFAKPLFDVLADSPHFFVARGNTRGDILAFAICFTLIPPTALALSELLVAWRPTLRRTLHLVFVAGLFAVFALQVLDDLLSVSSVALIATAGLLGLAATAAYARTRFAPSVLTVLAPVPLVFLSLFLLASPVSKLVVPQGEAEGAEVDLRSKTPVVMVVFDEFDPNMLMDGRQRIDRTRYPNLAALSADATWYRNATTVNSQTARAVPALLTGRRPTRDLLPIPADYPDTLFSLLADSHSLHITETATEVCPERLCGARARDPVGERLRSLAKDLAIVSLHRIAPEGLESRLPAVDRTFGDFGGGGRDEVQSGDGPGIRDGALTNRRAQFTALLRGMRPERGRPGLYFLHSALPHVPWQYLPGGQQYVSAGPDFPGLEADTWSNDPVPARIGLQRHLLQVGFVDHLVGRMVERLRRAGIYDRAMIVITADHGVSYRVGQPRRNPVAGNASDIAGVPLLIKYPGREGGRVDESPARTIDIVPTIAEQLGAKLPWKADGRPLGEAGQRARHVVVNWPAAGRGIDLPFEEYVREREAALFRMISLAGVEDGGARLYSSGADWHLLGRRVEGLPATRPSRGRIQLDTGELLDSYRPGASVAPSFVSGRITGGVGPHTPLAVAVNGKIRSVTESFEYEGDTRMAAIVPARAFRAGANSVQVFRVGGERPAQRLASLSVERPRSYRLVEDGGTAIVSDGRAIEVREGRVDGFYDRFEPDDQGTRVSGWAVVHGAPQPAERILIFSRGRLVAEGEPTAPRPDIARQRGAAALRSGFQLLAGVTGIEADDIRVIALRGDRASELPHYEP